MKPFWNWRVVEVAFWPVESVVNGKAKLALAVSAPPIIERPDPVMSVI